MLEEKAGKRFLDYKYTGEVAERYLERRKDTFEWKVEQDVVYAMLARAVRGGTRMVVDVPVGTGRFFEYYHSLGLSCVGYDISEAMLKQARTVANELGLQDIKLEKADIRNLSDCDRAFDVVVCVRYMQHVNLGEFKDVLKELARVSSRYIVLGVHVVGNTPKSRMSPFLTAARHPLRTIGHAFAVGQRRLTRLMAGPASKSTSDDSYMKAADKPETAVLKEFQSCGLAIREDKLITTGINPCIARLYKMFLLEKMAGSGQSRIDEH
jgi:ubiquinone/menaquinone biosynthesis C-methylase UbiE